MSESFAQPADIYEGVKDKKVNHATVMWTALPESIIASLNSSFRI